MRRRRAGRRGGRDIHSKSRDFAFRDKVREHLFKHNMWGKNAKCDLIIQAPASALPRERKLTWKSEADGRLLPWRLLAA